MRIHHGVRITDAAIVAAVNRSARYISDRFLPDKAIDLIDEAASRLRIEIDSMPEELDILERKIKQLEIEKEALKKETDIESKTRLKELAKELENLIEERDKLKAQWLTEKNKIKNIREIKSKIENAKEQAKLTKEKDYLIKQPNLDMALYLH